MKQKILKVQAISTRIFLWTSPIAFTVLGASNFPNFEKTLWTTSVAAPVLAMVFCAWFLSPIVVLSSAFISPRYRDDVLSNVVLRKEQDEREEIISGRAAKKSILISVAAVFLLLLISTGRYNKAETVGKSSVTIGNIQFTDDTYSTTSSTDGAQIVHYGLLMSKTSLMLMVLLVQLASYHAIFQMSLRRDNPQ